MPRLCPCPACQRHVFACEEACPHCGERGSNFVATLALAATVAVACAPQADVYGPAPVDHSTRVSASATPSQDAPSTAIAVYGPPPIDSDQRIPSASSSSAGGGGPPSAAPTDTPPPRPDGKVYGPPPKDPNERLPVPKK